MMDFIYFGTPRSRRIFYRVAAILGAAILLDLTKRIGLDTTAKIFGFVSLGNLTAIALIIFVIWSFNPSRM